MRKLYVRIQIRARFVRTEARASLKYSMTVTDWSQPPLWGEGNNSHNTITYNHPPGRSINDLCFRSELTNGTISSTPSHSNKRVVRYSPTLAYPPPLLPTLTPNTAPSTPTPTSHPYTNLHSPYTHPSTLSLHPHPPSTLLRPHPSTHPSHPHPHALPNATKKYCSSQVEMRQASASQCLKTLSNMNYRSWDWSHPTLLLTISIPDGLRGRRGGVHGRAT